jgi:hypothetical protein
MSHVGGLRFRLSIRSLMVTVALSAILLLPLAWAVRQRELVVRAQRDAERARALGARARAEAMRAMYATNIRAANRSLATRGATTTGAGPADTASGIGLWAAIRVNHPVLSEAEAKDLDLEFSLVNDGDAVVDPKLAESRIVVNGKDLEDSGLILGNGPRDARSSALAPGGHLRFAYALGTYFKEPGTYRVSWHGHRFESPVVIFRVLPDEKPSSECSPRP